MVPLTKEQQKESVKETAATFEAIRIKHGAEPCKHGEAVGTAVFIFYPDGWMHSTLQGDFTVQDLLGGVYEAIRKHEAEEANSLAS